MYLDLLDRASLGVAVTTVLERWGRIDVLVNNGRYIGPGHMDLFMDTPMELHEKHLEAERPCAHRAGPSVLPQMLARGGGDIVTVTSGAGNDNPPAPAGAGGWGLGYAMSKAAVHRLAGILHVELHGQGIRAYNLHPGAVQTRAAGRGHGRVWFRCQPVGPAGRDGSGHRLARHHPGGQRPIG